MERQKICLVTGGSRGIGAAIVDAVARDGFDVCINYVKNEDLALDLANAVEASYGVRAMAWRADVAKLHEVKLMFAKIDEVLGPVTALVNNAGITGVRKAFLDESEADFSRVIRVNLKGTENCTRAAIERMVKPVGTGGAIVNVSSTAARTGGRMLTAYTASKRAVEGLTKALSNDYARHGIRVNAVRPGIIATDQQPLNDPAWVVRTLSSIPLRRIGEPSEVASVVSFLLSEEARYISGSIIPIDGARN